MVVIIYSNCIGTFAFSDKKLVDERLFSKQEIVSYGLAPVQKEILETEQELLKKHSGSTVQSKTVIPPAWILEFFSNEKYIKQFRDATMLITKRKISSSVRPDHLIIQASNNIEEIDKVANNLSERLREWYELYNPEFSKSIESDEKFAELIQTRNKTELLAEVKLTAAESMGAEFEPKQLEPIMALAREISSLFALRAKQSEYVQICMQEQMPNMTELAGASIGAKLLAIAGSLEKLALFPASTMQLLGAEKALFRHIKTGARPPKYGVIINHPMVAKAKPADKGRTARALADKLSICAKVDFFKGAFCGDRLKKELEEKFKQQ